MKKRHYIQILLITLFTTLIVEIFFGGYLAALVSTWPFVRKLGILDPRAPIVINRRETVRVSDSGDIHDAVDSVKSKLSTIVVRSNGQLSVAGGAINLSSDGLFLTGRAAVTGDPAQYSIVLQDGRSAIIQQIIFDPGSNLVLVKAAIDRVPVADFKDSKDVSPSDRALFVYNTIPNSSPNFYANFVTVAQLAGLKQIFNSDRPSRTFGVMPVSALIPGEAVLDLSGQVIGMWTGGELMSSDVMRPAYESYFNSKTAIIRPAFGFMYEMITKVESGLSGIAAGAQVLQVTAGYPAQAAGLEVGDIITKFGDTNLDQDGILEDVLEKYKPGDQVTLVALRNKQPMTIILKVGELK